MINRIDCGIMNSKISSILQLQPIN